MKTSARKGSRGLRAVVLLLLAALATSCNHQGSTVKDSTETTLRIGYGEVGSIDALNGMRQLLQLFSTEGLARIGDDGRPIPSLAASWTVAPDRRSISIRLRSNVKFHDGSPLTATVAAKALQQVLPQYMGGAFSDVERISANGESHVDIALRRPTPFLLEALEVSIQKPDSGGAGTGPYMAVGPSAPNEIRANAEYYLGRPTIDRIVVTPYPNVRSAWAEMLRDRIDMLYEVGLDGLDSLTSAKDISVFTHVRRYQHVLVFNSKAEPLRSREIRRALNQAIDKTALIQEALNGHAVPSSGLIWPSHWAFQANFPQFAFDPEAAANVIKRHTTKGPLRFRCLVRPDLERIALVIKRQLEAVGVEMSVEEAPFDTILQAMSGRDFDAVLLELASGPNLFRPYLLWHSGGLVQPRDLGTPELDAAFDRVRYSTNEDEYRTAVAGVQEATLDDPPAIFLAWSQRARAVNRRFDVVVEPDRDILTTLRLWRPTTDVQYVGRN